MLTQSVCSEKSTIAGMAANLVLTMSCFAKARDAGIIRDLPGLRIVDVGPEYALFNSALLTMAVESEDDLNQRIDAASDHFHQRRSHWCFWVCEHLLPKAMRRSLDRVFTRRGLRFTSRTPGLWTPSLAEPDKRAQPDLVIRRVSDWASRRAFCHLMSASFEGPAGQLSDVYGSADFWLSDFRGYIGSWNGLDISAGATVSGGGVIGIYAVATMPSFTRRGFAEALVRKAVAESTKLDGELPLVLQSTPVALNLYRRLGFQQVTSFLLYSSS